MLYWKLGNYEFQVNPSSATETLEFVGDVVTTESGRSIVQQAGYVRKVDCEVVFYQPKPSLLGRYSSFPGAECISYCDGKYYLGTFDGKIYVLNHNFVLEKTIIPQVSVKYFRGIVALGSNIYVLAQDVGGSSHMIYKLDHTGSVLATYNYGGASAISLTSDGQYLYKLLGSAVVEQVKLVDGNLVTSYNLLQQVSGYFTSLCFVNNEYCLAGASSLVVIADLVNNSIIYTLYADEFISEVDFGSVAYNGEYFVVLNKKRNTIDVIRLNLVEMFLYDFQKHATENGLVLIDEFGLSRTVSVSSVEITRLPNYYLAYSVRFSMNEVINT